MTQPYPFSAVYGADQMLLALLLNAVSPAIGGVLVRGEKGTAKSTAVRALAALLPPVAVVAGCRFSCDPNAPEQSCPDGPHEGNDWVGLNRPARLVELPIGASEDRVAGSLDLEKALGEGVRAFEPGLLASAHRGILYVDEVNLLADHLVDVLLDAAAMGRNNVERDAVSVSHPARFVLIGSMNPEEGELRPQLLDRFGLTVEVAASRDPQIRVEVIRRRLAADADPRAFEQRWAGSDAELRSQIVLARARLAEVQLGDMALRQIAEVCAAFDVDGMRADIVMARTAIAHAAWQGRPDVTAEDVKVAATLALPHRRRRNPFDEPGLDPEALEEALSRTAADEDPEPDPEPEPDPNGGPSEPSDVPADQPAADQPAVDQQEPSDVPADQPTADSPADSKVSPRPAPQDGPGQPRHQQSRIGKVGKAKSLRGTGGSPGAPGRRAAARTGRGRSVGPMPPSTQSGPLHLRATVATAAPHQVSRGRTRGPLRLAGADLRRAELRGKEANLVLFVVDASGSMAARNRMAEVKGAVLALLTDAYQRRDKVGLIAFRGKGAELILAPTTSVVQAARQLETMKTGGRTPLAAGFTRALQVIATERLRDPLRRPLVLLVTDGRAENAAAVKAGAALAKHDLIVIDCERGPVRLGLARRLAEQLGAQYFALPDIASAPIAALVDDWRAA